MENCCRFVNWIRLRGIGLTYAICLSNDTYHTTGYKNVFLWRFKPATFCCNEWNYPLLSATTIRNLQQPEQRSDSKARACPEARYKVYSGPSIYL